MIFHAFFGLFSKEKKEELNKALEKTKESVFQKISRAVAGKTTVDASVLDNLEEILVTSDVGVNTTLKIIDRVEERVSKDKYLGGTELNRILKEEIGGLLEEIDSGNDTEFTIPIQNDPYVIMVVGVNGVGKTTTVGKLAYQFRKAGKKVIIGAADTFRAAAIEQLQIWAERVDVPIVAQKIGADPASVAFDTLESGKTQNADVILIDTAGRLHNKVNLMNELSKIKKVINVVLIAIPGTRFLIFLIRSFVFFFVVPLFMLDNSSSEIC